MLYREDMTSYYTDLGNNLYQMIGYCESPTVIMQNIRTGQIDHIVPDCPNAERFIKLIPENKEEV